MKQKKKALIISLVLAVIATVVLLVLPYSGNLCVAYICFLAALAMMLGGAFYVVKRKLPGGFARLKRRIWIAPASLVISAAVLALERTGVFCLPFEMHIVAQLAVLAAGAIKMLGIGTPRKIRPRPEEKPAEAAEGETKQTGV